MLTIAYNRCKTSRGKNNQDKGSHFKSSTSLMYEKKTESKIVEYSFCLSLLLYILVSNRIINGTWNYLVQCCPVSTVVVSPRTFSGLLSSSPEAIYHSKYQLVQVNTNEHNHYIVSCYHLASDHISQDDHLVLTALLVLNPVTWISFPFSWLLVLQT